MRDWGKLGVLVVVSGWLAQQALATVVNGRSSHQVPVPGGLADAGGRVGYVTSVSQGIEAIDLLSGDVLWSSQEAEVPVLLSHDRLYAQAGTKRNRLRVLVYDLTRKGEVVLESDPVVFPDWVITGAAPGCSFKTEWRLEKEHLVLAWEARAWYHEKAKPTADQEAAARKHADGLVRIHLVTGQVAKFPAEAPGVMIGVPVPQKDLDKKAVRWQGQVGDQYRAIVLEEDGDKQKMVMLNWDRLGARTGEPRELLVGNRLALMPTLDNRIVCVRESATGPDLRSSSEDRQKYAWSLYSLESGEPVARVVYEASTLALTVIGPRLFVEQAGSIHGSLANSAINTRVLKAIDLKSGKFLWQHTIAGKTVHPPER